RSSPPPRKGLGVRATCSYPSREMPCGLQTGLRTFGSQCMRDHRTLLEHNHGIHSSSTKQQPPPRYLRPQRGTGRIRPWLLVGFSGQRMSCPRRRHSSPSRTHLGEKDPTLSFLSSTDPLRCCLVIEDMVETSCAAPFKITGVAPYSVLRPVTGVQG